MVVAFGDVAIVGLANSEITAMLRLSERRMMMRERNRSDNPFCVGTITLAFECVREIFEKQVYNVAEANTLEHSRESCS